MHEVGEHLANLIEFGFAVAFRVVDAVINQPELILIRIDIHTRDHAVRIAAVLTAHQFDLVRKFLSSTVSSKDDVALDGFHDLRPDIIPDQARGELFLAQKPIDGVVRKLLGMVSIVGQRVIDLTDQQVLTIIKTAHRFAHEPRLYRFFKHQATSTVSFA